MYHTQERRDRKLEEPIKCVKDNAWLGTAYYFWYSEGDAIFWGITSKRRTGWYDVYISDIECSNVLDTVFNEEHYIFWLRQIEKASKNFMAKARIKPTLKQLNDYFLEKNIWTKFDGIMFQDISNNPDHFYVKEFQYIKRIQLGVFNTEIINNFTHHFEGQCV